MTDATPQPPAAPQPEPPPPQQATPEPPPQSPPKPDVDSLFPPRPRKQNVLTLTLQFPLEYGLFIAVNLLDLLLTMLLINYGGGEANPLAFGAIQWMGKPGLIIFKVLLMLVVIGLCEVIAKRKRLAARLIIWLGILMLAGICTLTSFYLYNQLTMGAP